MSKSSSKVGRRYAVLGSAGFAVGLALACASPSALAVYRSTSAVVCQPDQSTRAHGYENSDASTSVFNSSSSFPADFVCPVVDNPDLALGSLTKITAYVVDGNTATVQGSSEVSMKLCGWDAYDLTDLYCGAESSTWDPAVPAFEGTKLLSITDLSATSGHTLYLWARLPRNNGFGASRIRTLNFEI